MGLALRGWGPAAFDSVTPDFLAAARWALFLEELTPMWRAANSTLTEDLPKDPAAKIAAYVSKQQAQRFLEDWRPVLFPADDDG